LAEFCELRLAGNTLELSDIITEDQLGTAIARNWVSWHSLRSEWVAEVEDVRKHVYATDTTKTTNSQLPWKNKTTVPKLCQIRDNLYSNYVAAMFPKRKWLTWVADDRDSDSISKRKSIEAYMGNVIAQPAYKPEIEKLLLDYIDYGNCFVMPEWIDNRVEQKDKTQVGYVGPAPRRISPLDIVFNPIASSFENSPKIIRSLVSIGEVKEILERLTTDENRQAYEELFNYMVDLRMTVRGHSGEMNTKDALYNVDGFTGYQHYLQGDYVELLTFYGDIYDYEKKKFYKNHVIIVADRHKVLSIAPNPSYFGYPPIFHMGWRKRQDNLWAMGPLANLVGMQYRIDHLENLKADCFDLIAFPPLKIKGYVQDFVWGPMAKIYVGDDGSDVEVLAVPFQVLQTNSEITLLQNTMEEMAGAPKEAMGIRSPGEKTAYEVTRLENAGSRIFQTRIVQFEEMHERLLNGLLELARRNVTSAIEVKIYDDEFQASTFESLDPAELIGNGCIRPVAARHFAEKAELVQNLNNFFQSVLGQDQDIKSHFSSIKLAKMFEELLDITEYEIVLPYIRLAEQKEAQQFIQAAQEQVMMEAQTPAGLHPDDYDPSALEAGPTPAAPPAPENALGPSVPMGAPPTAPG
jgi:hypothetical protein